MAENTYVRYDRPSCDPRNGESLPVGPLTADRASASVAGRKTDGAKPKTTRRRCEGCDRLAMPGEYYCYLCASAR